MCVSLRATAEAWPGGIIAASGVLSPAPMSGLLRGSGSRGLLEAGKQNHFSGGQGLSLESYIQSQSHFMV